MCQDQVSSFFVYAWKTFVENDKQKIFLFSQVFPLETKSYKFQAYTIDNDSYYLNINIKYDGGMYGSSLYGWNISVYGNVITSTGRNEFSSMTVSILALF